MEDRARAAAAASRARSSDSDAIQRNYVTPGLAGQPISTVDAKRSFETNLACQKTASLLEILVQPSPTGDLGAVQVARDVDLDGTIDSRSTLPVPVSGLCANGIISCQPGSWSGCRTYRWDVDSARNLKLAEAAMPELAGCYCINASCGANLAWSNMPGVLRDLGGGMIGALTTADPRIGVAQALIEGAMIRYVGAQATACTNSPALSQLAYRATPTTIAGDAQAVSASSSVFQALSGSPAGLGKAQQLRQCTIERQVSVTGASIDVIVQRVSGGYATNRYGKSVEFLMGSPANNSLEGGNCSLFDFRMTLRVEQPERITSARLIEYFGDDWAQVRIDGQLIASGPSPWTSEGHPPAKCERNGAFHAAPNVDLKPWLSKGDHEVWLRVAVADGGEAMARIQLELDDSCKFGERLVDRCTAIASDRKCRLDSEHVDSVQTFRNGVKTGLHPLPQRRQFGTSACPVELQRDFFQRDRVYTCEIDSSALPAPDLSRGTYILDRSTEALLADRVRTADGGTQESIRPFSLPARGPVPACEPICKTRAPTINTAAAPQGVVGSRQNDPASFDTFYHSCGDDNRCPLGPGEELVSACGCLNDFPEAVVMMQTVRLAGADLTCTAAPQ
ncbi:hypothetical protein [Sphingomonas turrisvirgatae]|uniref:Uncharacterized protein n=1 Tax=Sphingomonas turrisvirgatae TaxID=1888892 RepID=A0A1E3LYD1_9SPHN|nr:hypothetical protein [Sphingomonas turrisvirgatae]ODP38791.1 hypothetical protein BFL28_13440 [Sphingomonas turrisvirgatae]